MTPVFVEGDEVEVTMRGKAAQLQFTAGELTGFSIIRDGVAHYVRTHPDVTVKVLPGFPVLGQTISGEVVEGWDAPVGAVVVPVAAPDEVYLFTGTGWSVGCAVGPVRVVSFRPETMFRVVYLP